MMDVSAQIFLDPAPASKGNGNNLSNASNDNSGKESFSSVLKGERSNQQSSEHSSKSDEVKKDKVESTSSNKDNAAQKHSEVSEAPAEQQAKPEKPAEKAEGRGPEQAAEKMEEKVAEDKPMPTQANAEHGQQQADERHALLALLLKQSDGAQTLETDEQASLDLDEQLMTQQTTALQAEQTDPAAPVLQLPDVDDGNADKVFDELENVVTQQTSDSLKESKPEDATIVKEDPKPEVKADPVTTAEQAPEVITTVAQVKTEQAEQKDDEPVKQVDDTGKRTITKADLLQQQAKQSNEEKQDDKPQTGSLEELDANASADKLAEETLQQLERHNMKFEAILAAKNAHQKQSSATDSIDMLSDKLGMQNGIDRASMSASSTGQANGVGLRGQNNAGMPSYVMDTPVESDEWGAVFSKRINFLAKNGVQHAEIRLDPPEMGRVNVKIKISNDQATIHFTAQHGNVRDAIESSMSRLRDMLQESGLGLGNVDVSTQQFAQRQQEQFAQGHEGHFGRASFGGDANDMDDSADLLTGLGRAVSSDNLVDYFA